MQTLQSFWQRAGLGDPNEKLAWEGFQCGSFKMSAAVLIKLIFKITTWKKKETGNAIIIFI